MNVHVLRDMRAMPQVHWQMTTSIVFYVHKESTRVSPQSNARAAMLANTRLMLGLHGAKNVAQVATLLPTVVLCVLHVL